MVEGRGVRPTEADSSVAQLAAPLRRAFGFAADDDASWFANVGARVCQPTLGRVGSFELIAEAGRGGQGLVYRARQQRPARDVALKRLAAGVFATPSMRARFEREIEAVSALDHPNIVRVFGVEDIDGQLVVALQWIDGVPFDRWARPAGGATRPVDEVLDVFQRICDAVHHAHQRGVIHRDLKPSNVLVDSAGEPHVLDFGLARRREHTSDAGLTCTGAFLGTPAYASPEQLRGDNSVVDVRSDVYSLGAMLYVCLTGATPVDASVPPAEMLREIETSGPLPPSTRNKAISRELSDITLKALQGDPGQRYQSVDALQADLLRLRRGESVLAHPPSATYQARKFIRRHRLAVGVIGGFLVLTTTAAVTSTMLYFRAEGQRERADEALVKANAEAGTARGAKSLLQDMFVSAGRAGKARGSELTVREMLDRAGEKLEAGGYSFEPAEVAGLRMMIADAYRELGSDAASEPHYRAALKLRREVYGNESLAVAQSLDALARVCRVLGKLNEAEPLIEEAWAVYQKTVPANDPYFAQAANSVALIKRSLRKFDEAEKWYLEAISRYVTAFGPESENVPYAKNNLGALYVTMGRLADAEAQFRDALARSQKLHGSAPHQDTVLAMSSLADVLALRGDPDKNAEALFQESHRLSVQLYGANHFRVGQLLQRHARFLSGNERNDEAGDALRSARDAFAESHRWSDVLATANMLSALLLKSKQFDEAGVLLKSELERAGPHVKPDDVNLAAAHLELGSLLVGTDQDADAELHLRFAEAALESKGPNAGPEWESVRARLAAIRGRDK